MGVEVEWGGLEMVEWEGGDATGTATGIMDHLLWGTLSINCEAITIFFISIHRTLRFTPTGTTIWELANGLQGNKGL